MSSIHAGGKFIFCWNLLKSLDVNFVQKCQICVICENVEFQWNKLLAKGSNDIQFSTGLIWPIRIKGLFTLNVNDNVKRQIISLPGMISKVTRASVHTEQQQDDTYSANNERLFYRFVHWTYAWFFLLDYYSHGTTNDWYSSRRNEEDRSYFYVMMGFNVYIPTFGETRRSIVTT